jgi:hypothetical protein
MSIDPVDDRSERNRNNVSSTASKSTFATQLPDTSAEISSAWRLDTDAVDSPLVWELKEAIQEVDEKETAAAQRVTAFGDNLVPATDRAVEPAHHTHQAFGDAVPVKSTDRDIHADDGQSVMEMQVVTVGAIVTLGSRFSTECRSRDLILRSLMR